MKKRSLVLMLCLVLGFCMTAALSGCATSQGYSSTLKAATITSPTISKERTLRVGVNADNAPYAVVEETSGKIVGLDVDIAAAISDELGLKLEIIDIGTNSDKNLNDGTIDIAMGVLKSDTSIRNWLTDVYIPSAPALFATSANTSIPKEGSDIKIAAQPSSKAAWAATAQFGDGVLVDAKNLETGFSDLGSGNIQFMAADALIGTYVTDRKNIDASIIALLEKPSGYAISVLESNSELKTAIGNALSTLNKNGTISLIETKWLGAPFDLSKVQVIENNAADDADSEESEEAADDAANGVSGQANVNTEE